MSSNPEPQSLPLRDSGSLPLLGFGTCLLDDGEPVKEAILTALQAGYRHLDCAAIYGNEAGVGAALAESAIPRSEIFVTTKLWTGGLGDESAKDFDSAVAACKESLAKLQLDYVDLYLVHAPFCSAAERLQQYRALVELQKEGLVRSIGVSNFSAEHILELEASGLPTPSVNQLEVHPYNTKPELLAFLRKKGIQVVAYSSLAPLPDFRKGPGMFENAAQHHPLGVEGKLGTHDAVAGAAAAAFGAVAERHGKSSAQVLLRWAVQQGIAVIPKSKSEGRMKENADVFGWALTTEEMDALSALDKGAALAWGGMDPVATAGK